MKRTVKAALLRRQIVWSLAQSDFKNRYLGSYFGVFWAFFLPLLNLAIIWAAFQLGFKTGNKSGTPFVLWLISGLFPWTFFSEAMLSSSNAVVEKSFLVKKVVFPVELLPLIKVLAALFPFLFLTLVMFVTFILYGFLPDLFWLQVPYYMICLCFLVLSLSWLTSSIVVLYRDFGQLVSVGVQLGFWATPIFWSPEQIPNEYRFIASLNPVNYVISGYRDSLISKVWFWQKPMEMLFFWGVSIFLAYFGFYVFKRLRPHFADVL